MQIKDILSALKNVPGDTLICFDFGDLVPVKVVSWRGIYSEPSITYESSEFIVTLPTVKDFVDELEDATSGMIFHGYKGGKFAFTQYHELHVDLVGHCSNTDIIGIDVQSDLVIIRTAKCYD